MYNHEAKRRGHLLKRDFEGIYQGAKGLFLKGKVPKICLTSIIPDDSFKK